MKMQVGENRMDVNWMGENEMKRKIPIRTMITDFPYNYSHEAPFPTDEKQREIVNVNFKNIFDLASSYLG